MSKFFVSLLVVLPLLVNAQDEKVKHQVSIDVFNQLQIPGPSKYFNDSWLMENNGGDETHVQQRKYTRFGFGMEYTALLRKNNFINVDLGVGYRKIFEQVSYFAPNPVLHPDEAVKTGADISYNQLSYGATVFFGKTVGFENFVFNLAAGPSYLLQGLGKQEYFIYFTENVYPDIITDSTGSFTSSTFGIGHNFGMGMKIGIHYSFNDHLMVGCEIASYLFYSRYNNPSNHKSTYYERKSYDGITSDILISESESMDYTNFSQLSFTNISPSFKVTYTF